MKPKKPWNHETVMKPSWNRHETMKPWNHETYDNMKPGYVNMKPKKPLKPWNHETYEIENIWNHET